MQHMAPWNPLPLIAWFCVEFYKPGCFLLICSVCTVTLDESWIINQSQQQAATTKSLKWMGCWPEHLRPCMRRLPNLHISQQRIKKRTQNKILYVSAFVFGLLLMHFYLSRSPYFKCVFHSFQNISSYNCWRDSLLPAAIKVPCDFCLPYTGIPSVTWCCKI